MDDIKWGAEIAVDGKRPAWLAGDQTIAYQHRDTRDWVFDTKFNSWVRGADSFDLIVAIRLPADHFAYKAIAAGFEPWGGGDEAPADWDGDRRAILYRDGSILGRSPNTWRHVQSGADIIGYRKKVKAPAEVAPPIDWLRPIEHVDGTPLHKKEKGEFGAIEREDGQQFTPEQYGGNGPYSAIYTYSDGRYDREKPPIIRNRAEPDTDALAQARLKTFPDYVAVKRMTEAEIADWMRAHGWGITTRSHDDVKSVLRDLGLIREETRAERFARETGHEVTPAVEAALGWDRAA